MNLNQVTIPSHDLAASVRFYQAIGLRLIVDSVPRYARFECPVGDSTFSVHHVDGAIAGEGVSVYFECEDLDERVSELLGRGIVFDLEPTDQRWLWREAHLRDPDGNRVILYRAGANRKYPPWRLESEPASTGTQ